MARDIIDKWNPASRKWREDEGHRDRNSIGKVMKLDYAECLPRCYGTVLANAPTLEVFR